MDFYPIFHKLITIIRNKPYLALVIVGLMICLALVYQLINMVVEHSLGTDPAFARKRGAPMPVISATVQTGSLNSIIGGDCFAQASQTAVLTTDLTYPVMMVAVEEGDRVKQGQLLAAFDPTNVDDDLEYAERVITQAKHLMDEIDTFFAGLRAYQKKPEAPPVPFQDLLRIFGSIESRELDLNQAYQYRTELQRKQAKLRLLAPFDGVVTSRNIFVGQLPQRSDELLAISNLNPLKLVCSFSEDQYRAITTSERTEVTFSSRPGEKLEARFDRILPLVDSKTRSLKVSIILANPDMRYLPGMHAVVRLSKTLTALRIPAIATINPDGVHATVFVWQGDDHISLREIETGLYADGYIEVVSGLSEGDRVVVSGQTYLQDGDRVKEGDHELSPLYWPKQIESPTATANPESGEDSR